MKPIRFSAHARFEMRRRSISPAQVEGVVRRPQQVISAPKGRRIFQSKIGSVGRILLRVFVKESTNAYHVITAYKTSKIAKYWRQS